MTSAARRVFSPAAAGVASGFLLVAAFPPIDQRWVAFVALGPLFFALRRAGAAQGALAGSAFGATFFGLLLSWLVPFGWLAWGALVGAQTAMTALFGLAGAFVVRSGPIGRLLGIPLVWTGIEMLRSRWPLGGFAWGAIGYTQHAGPPVRPLARLGGVFAVGLAVAGVNALVAEAAAGRSRRIAALVAATVVALAPMALPTGLAGDPAGEFDVAAVQGNVPAGTFQGLRGSRRGPEDLTIVLNHARASAGLAAEPPDLVIWPENAVDRDPFEEPQFMRILQESIAEVRAPFLVGAVLDDGPDTFRNTNLLFDADGSFVTRYDKLHLVPFGEYVPWPSLRRWVGALDQVPTDGVPGTEAVVFEVGGVRVGSVICFESAFPHLVRQFVRRGAQVIVVSTNNASFGRSPAASQHLAMSRMRAVEHGRPVVHAAIAGISAIIGPDGGVLQEAGLFRPAVLRARLTLPDGRTPYDRWGGGIEAGMGAAAGGAVAGAFTRRRGDRRGEHP